MKTFIAAAVIIWASLARAQLEGIPSCATNCLVKPLSTDGCSSLDDFACHCKSADKLFAAVIPCLDTGCSADDKNKTIQATEQACAAAGVSIQVPESSPSSKVATAASTGNSPSTPSPQSTGSAAKATQAAGLLGAAAIALFAL